MKVVLDKPLTHKEAVMKDVARHLRHVQKKVIRSERQNTFNGKVIEEAVPESERSSISPEKKMDQNHRAPRLPKQSFY